MISKLHRRFNEKSSKLTRGISSLTPKSPLSLMGDHMVKIFELYVIDEIDKTDKLITMKKLYAGKFSFGVETNHPQTMREFNVFLSSYTNPFHFMHEMCTISL